MTPQLASISDKSVHHDTRAVVIHAANALANKHIVVSASVNAKGAVTLTNLVAPISASKDASKEIEAQLTASAAVLKSSAVVKGATVSAHKEEAPADEPKAKSKK